MRAAPWKSGPSGPRKPFESVTALAAVATICRAGAFFRKLFSRATENP